MKLRAHSSRQQTVTFPKDAGRGVCLRDTREVPRQQGWARDQGHCGTNGIGPGPQIPSPPPEKGEPHARRPQAVLCDSRDVLRTYSCYISCGLIESRFPKSSSLTLSLVLFPSLLLWELLSLVFSFCFKKTQSEERGPNLK